MSIAIDYHYFDEDVDKKRAETELNHRVSTEFWGEGGPGLQSPIIWYDDIICKDIYDAQKVIESIDNGENKQIAVKFKHTKENLKWLVKIEYYI